MKQLTPEQFDVFEDMIEKLKPYATLVEACCLDPAYNCDCINVLVFKIQDWSYDFKKALSAFDDHEFGYHNCIKIENALIVTVHI